MGVDGLHSPPAHACLVCTHLPTARPVPSVTDDQEVNTGVPRRKKEEFEATWIWQKVGRLTGRGTVMALTMMAGETEELGGGGWCGEPR